MRLAGVNRRGLAACVSVLRSSKHGVANLAGHASRLFLASCLALVLVTALSQRAEAQTFRFQFSGPSLLVVDVFLTTIASGACPGCRQATGIDGGGANTWQQGANNGTITALGTATIDSVPINFIFDPAKGSGVGDGVFRNGLDAISLRSLAANNNVGSDRDIILWASGNVDRSSISPAGANQTGGGGDVGGSFIVTQVPGPLAGAGMLSYLAVLLIGFVWRGKWLLARTRRWLASTRTGETQTA